jgi:hypothetical protein
MMDSDWEELPAGTPGCQSDKRASVKCETPPSGPHSALHPRSQSYRLEQQPAASSSGTIAR